MLVCNNYPSISQVVLEEAKIKEAPKLECPSTPAPSVEDIEKRLKVPRRVIIIRISLILSASSAFRIPIDKILTLINNKLSGGGESTKINGSFNLGKIGPGREKERGGNFA